MAFEIPSQSCQLGDWSCFNLVCFLGVKVGHLVCLVFQGLPDRCDAVSGKFWGFEGNFESFRYFLTLFRFRVLIGFELFEIFDQIGENV